MIWGEEILFSQMQPFFILVGMYIEKKYSIASLYCASMSHTTFTYFGDLQQYRVWV